MHNFFKIPNTITLDVLNLPAFMAAGVQLAVLRLDKTDKWISGNKWFKLHYHVKQAMHDQARGLISVGGPHSNHLHALAVAGYELGLSTVGLIRGEPQKTPTTQDLEHFGMELNWLTYGEYRERYQQPFWQKWLANYPDYYAVPEGGGGLLGAKGCNIIPKLINERLASIGWADYDAMYVSVATGSTLVGIIWGDEGKHQLVGCLAVPSKYGVDKQIAELLATVPINYTNYQLQSAARKGFGQVDQTLLSFMLEVEAHTGLLLDPVYTAKTLYFLYEQVITGQICKGTRIVVLHTGGLQGRRVLLEG